MRLTSYLSENYVVLPKGEDVRKLISPKFRQETKGEFLYRGSDRLYGDGYIVKTSRLGDRVPFNTRPVSHAYLNKLFEKKFGWPVRNGVFVSGSETWADDYGMQVNFFYPIGDYKYCWNKQIKDLYLNPVLASAGDTEKYKDDYNDIKELAPKRLSEKKGYYYGITIDYTSLEAYIKSMDEGAKKMINEYQSTDLHEAIESGNEISFWCEKYILSKGEL